MFHCGVGSFLFSSNMNVDIKLSSEQVLEWSRYQHEYHELEYIAKGGFGHVYKARNKLDGGEYAIKKIFLRLYGFLFKLFLIFPWL